MVRNRTSQSQSMVDYQVLNSQSHEVSDMNPVKTGFHRETKMADIKVKKRLLENIEGCYGLYLRQQKLG